MRRIFLYKTVSNLFVLRPSRIAVLLNNIFLCRTLPWMLMYLIFHLFDRNILWCLNLIDLILHYVYLSAVKRYLFRSTSVWPWKWAYEMMFTGSCSLPGPHTLKTRWSSFEHLINWGSLLIKSLSWPAWLPST
jgi:hypothetical protein